MFGCEVIPECLKSVLGVNVWGRGRCFTLEDELQELCGVGMEIFGHDAHEGRVLSGDVHNIPGGGEDEFMNLPSCWVVRHSSQYGTCGMDRPGVADER